MWTQGLKIMWDASRPSPSLLLLPSSLPFPIPFLPFPFPSLPLRSRHPQLRLGGLGERLSSHSGSGRSAAAKRILTHFRPKFAPFEYLMQLSDTLSHNIISHKRAEPITITRVVSCQQI